jgi:glycosyltransferase involved in cell wall biosynthesis
MPVPLPAAAHNHESAEPVPSATCPVGPPALSVVFRESGDRVDGIRDYAHMLASGLGSEGAPASLSLLPSSMLPRPPRDTDALLINYNAFSWGRWGLAPGLPSSLARLRVCRARPTIGVIVHEPFVDLVGLRQTLMGAWQRAQLAAMLRMADVAFVCTDPWVPLVRRWAGSRTPVHHVPVGSNLPDMRNARDEERARLGLDGDAVVLAMFGGHHPSRPVEHLRRAARAGSQAGRRTAVLNLGADPPDLAASTTDVQVVTPGLRTPVELARLLSAADIFVGPFMDGASSRRTTLAAALQHGLPTVSTSGEGTDPFLERSGALILVPAANASTFGEAVAELVDDPDRRRVLGLRARRLFDERFAWGVIARRLLELLAVAREEKGRDKLERCSTRTIRPVPGRVGAHRLRAGRVERPDVSRTRRRR